MSKHNKIFIIISVVVALALAVAGYLIFGHRSSNVWNTYTVKPVDITEEVATSGKVKAADEVDMAYERGGRVVRVPVSAGDAVKRGALLVALDASDAASAKDQAAAALSAAQIALEKMKQPPEAIDLLTAEDAVSAATDAVSKAQSDLNKTYDSAAGAVDDSVVDMRAIVSGLKDVLHGTDLNPGQDNIDYYADTAKVYDASADTYRLTAENSCQSALSVYASLAQDNTMLGSNPDHAAAAKIVSEAYDAAKLTADAVKSASDLVNLYVGKLAEKQISVPAAANTHVAELAGFSAKANNDFSALGNSVKAITAGEDALAAGARTLTERNEALSKLQAGAENIDIRAQQTRVDQAQAAYATAANALAKTALYAPFDGTVSAVNVSVGELAGAGAPAVSLLSNARYEIDAFVSEADIAKFVAGAPAEVTLDTFGANEKFPADVISIDPAQTVTNGVGAYGIKLQFANDDPRIKSGMTANIDISAAAHAGVLAVPASAIITRGADKFVLVDTGAAKPVETKVMVGLSGADNMVEIITGLKVGDKVVTFGGN